MIIPRCGLAAAALLPLTLCAAAPAGASTRAAGHVTGHLTAPATVTQGHPGTFTIRLTRTGTATPTSWKLTFGDTTQALTGKNGPATRIRHTFTSTGWHTLTLTLRDSNRHTQTSRLKVFAVTPQPATGTPAAPAAVPAASPAAAVEPHTGSTPTVTAVTPASGPIGTAVTITGTNFTAPATVSFNGAPKTATVLSATNLTTSVTSAASTGPLTLTTDGATVPAGTFTVTPGTALNGPTTGPPTTATTLAGAGFAPNEAVDLYAGTTSLGTATTNSTGNLTQAITVPAAAQPGALQIFAEGQTSGKATQSTFTVQTDWAAAGGGPANSADNTYENTLNTGNVSGLGRAWTASLASGQTGQPTEVKGILYTASSGGMLAAVNAATGVTVWSAHATGAAVYESPAVANGLIYVGDESGTFTAYNASNGAVVWSHQNLGEFFDDQAEVAAGIAYIASITGIVYAYNATTGSLIWSLSLPGQNPAVYGSVSVAQGVAVVGDFGTGIVYAVNATTGAAEWTFTTNTTSFDFTPFIADGTVYLADQSGDVDALVLKTGHEQWTTKLSNGSIGTGAVGNGLVYVSGDYTLSALSTDSGALEWTYTMPAGEQNTNNGTIGGAFTSAGTLANGVLYTVASDGRLIAFNAAYGEVLWSYNLGEGTLYQAPTIANGVVFAGDSASELDAFSLPAGYTTPS